MTDPANLFLNQGSVRSNELSLTGRFHHDYGFEHGLFEILLRQKEQWAEKLFYPSEKDLKNWIDSKDHGIRQVPTVTSLFPDYQEELISELEFWNLPRSPNPISLTITRQGVGSLKQEFLPCSPVSLRNIERNAIGVNVGGAITAMKWVHDKETSYLAVFVVNSGNGLDSLVIDPEISMFPKTQPLNKLASCIQIWKYSGQSGELKLTQALDCSKFGCVSKLIWQPIRSLTTLGVLSGAFTDGRVHFFKIEPNESEGIKYAKIIESSWKISVLDERREKSHAPILDFDYLDHDRVIVGTFDGAIAEFFLPGTEKLKNEENFKTVKSVKSSNSMDLSSSTLHIPSFLHYVCDGAINSITVGEVQSSHVILVNSMSSNSFAFKYENLRQGRVEVPYTISTLLGYYHQLLRLFMYPDSAESMGYTMSKHPQLKGNLMMKTELVSAFHISEYLNHPYAIIGNICGKVFTLNFLRKHMAITKVLNKFLIPLQLWSLYIDPTDGYTLSGDYVNTPSDRNKVMYTVTPPEVVISSLAWNECLEASSVYAFGTYSGLMVVERLDPQFE